MSPETYAVLRVIHISAGILWAGALMYLGLMLQPVLRRLSPSVWAELVGGVHLRMHAALLGVYGALLATGVAMFLQRFPAPSHALVSGAGRAILASLVLSLAAVGSAWLVERPAVAGALQAVQAAGGEDAWPERAGALRARAAWAAVAGAVLALFTTALMAVQRLV